MRSDVVGNQADGSNEGLQDDPLAFQGARTTVSQFRALQDTYPPAPILGRKARAVIGVVLCVYVLLLASCSRYYRDPGDAATELVDAFVAADVERAKAVTVPEQWDRIEEWMRGRQTFVCRGGKDLTGTAAVGVHLKGEDEWSFEATYQCVSDKTEPYCLQVNDIQLRETEAGWKIYDWGKVCEANDYAYWCGEICR